MKEPSALLQLTEVMLRRCAEPDFERVLAQRLAHIFDADECMWADLRLAEEVGSNLVLGQQALTLPGPGAINVSLRGHPAVLSYVSGRSTVTPATPFRGRLDTKLAKNRRLRTIS